MTMPLVLSGIHYTYPGTAKQVLRGADLTLAPDGRTGLSGPNGSGKSTLLHIITGLIRPQQGHIAFEGKALVSEKDFCAARPRMGYLLQRTDDQLFCPTVLEDVAFGPRNLGLSSKEARARAEETLEQLGISHLAHRAGCNLSGGEQKMAALATILSMRPRLLLLDEPTNDLDPGSLELLIQTIARQNLPFIAVSHDSAFLGRVCTALLRLENGILQQE